MHTPPDERNEAPDARGPAPVRLAVGPHEVGPDQKLQVKQPIWKSLFFQIGVAIVLGITIGALWPTIGAQLKPIGDGFIRLIKMVIAPIIFLVIVTGIAHVGDVKSVGRVGVKALGYFLAASTFALAFGMLVGNVVRPGAGLHIDPASLNGAAALGRFKPREEPGKPRTLLWSCLCNDLVQRIDVFRRKRSVVRKQWNGSHRRLSS